MLIFNVIQLITDFPEDGDTCLVVDSISDCPREDVGLEPVELQTAMRRLETAEFDPSARHNVNSIYHWCSK